MSNSQKNAGFIALISVLIISTVLLATTMSLAQFGISNRYFILDLEHKTISEKLAEACVQIARIIVFNNPDYETGVAMSETVSGSTCAIVSITVNSTNVDESVIWARGESGPGPAITNLEVVVDNTTGSFLSWEERPSF